MIGIGAVVILIVAIAVAIVVGLVTHDTEGGDETTEQVDE